MGKTVYSTGVGGPWVGEKPTDRRPKPESK